MKSVLLDLPCLNDYIVCWMDTNKMFGPVQSQMTLTIKTRPVRGSSLTGRQDVVDSSWFVH